MGEAISRQVRRDENRRREKHRFSEEKKRERAERIVDLKLRKKPLAWKDRPTANELRVMHLHPRHLRTQTKLREAA